MSDLEIGIFPVPAFEYIKLGSDYNNIVILAADGRLVFSMPLYKNNPILIEDFSEGLYFLQGQSKTGKIKVGEFVVIYK